MNSTRQAALWALNQPDHPQGVEWISRACDDIIERAGVSHGRYNGVHAEFVALVRRGLLEIEQRKLGRLQGDHGAGYFDALFNPIQLPLTSFGEQRGRDKDHSDELSTSRNDSGFKQPRR